MQVVEGLSKAQTALLIRANDGSIRANDGSGFEDLVK